MLQAAYEQATTPRTNIYICPSLSAEEITAVAITTTGPGKMDEVITPPEVDEVMGDTEDDNDQDCGPSLEDMMS